MHNYFELIEYFPLAIEIQIALILFLFVTTTFILSRNTEKLVKTSQNYPYYFGFMFAPIYEESIFRGLIFGNLLNKFELIEALIISSIAFGLWHYKNIFFKSTKKTMFQVLFTGVLYGPLFGLVTYYSESIWPSVVLHYLNNLISLVWLSYSKKKDLEL